MNEQVEYIMKVVDEMSGTLKKIQENTEHVNSAVGKTKDTVGKLKGAFVEFFAVAKIFQWGEEAFNAYTQGEQASAQLTASLKSTGDAIGYTKEQLDKQAEGLSKLSLNAKPAITDMQAILATFTSIKGKAFEQSQQAVVDLAAKMHESLESAAVQVGKAINDPDKGVVALRRVGVNFDQNATNVIKHLVSIGQAGKAQQMILAELNKEFGGSAAAAAKANPFVVMKNQLEPIMEKIGGTINKVLIALMPIANLLLGVFSQLVDEILPPIIELLTPIINILKIIINFVMVLIQPIINALKPAIQVIGQYLGGWEKVMARLSPIFNFVAEIVGGVLGIVIKIVAHAILFALKIIEWISHLTLVRKIFEGIGWFIENVIIKPFKWLFEKIEKLFGITQSATSTAAGQEDAAEGAGATSTPAGTGGGENTPTSVMAGTEKNEAKLTNINIKIDTLAKFEFTPGTSAEDMVKKMKEVVVSTLLGAVNNSQLQIAGR